MSRTQSDVDAFENNDAVEEGFEIHGVERLHGCCLCDFNSTELLRIVKHVQSHSQEAPWDCWRCAHVLLGEDVDGELHDALCPDNLEPLTDGHPDDSDAFETTRPREEHKCTLCSFKSTFLSEVVNHIGQHVRKKKAVGEDPENIEGSKKHWDNAYACTECEFSCMNPVKLEKHMKDHSPNAEFKCRECSYEGASRLELQRHKRRVHGFLRPYECSLCSARFTRLDNLKTHVNIHTGERRFNCTKCLFSTPIKARLASHYNSHKDGNPKRGSGVCPVCRRCFTSYSQLEIHRKKHVLSPPFQCNSCGETFGSREDLFDHHTFHVDSVAMPCLFCDFKCFEDSTMHYHLGTVHGSEKPFQCDTCSSRFTSLVHWKRHQLVHTGVKPFKCDLCFARFSQAGNRKAHMLKIHNFFIPLPRNRSKSSLVGEEIVIIQESK
ncbi:hypothetical protein GE061_008755 [Apolygus lucorum]|uniref:C2H2-type domain-containing protein n=1 Tax=Apolygus lucorum TaxID=248454 RepID=A0A6A4JC34_APOLU|nr:hypothetical protein GE061_008755 [Apolygus lucorum]